MPLTSRTFRSLSVLLLAVSAGCASYTRMPPEDRTALDRALSGPEADQYLRLSSHVAPFFGDASKRLLTPYEPEDVRLLNDTRGNPILPGPSQGIIPAGAKARILKVEFPTAFVVNERVLYTPRTWPWVYLSVEGAPPGPPLVLVLPPNLDRPEDFRAELEKYLSPRELKAQLEAFAPAVRDAIREKRLVAHMPADAVRMAWGHPEVVRHSLDGTAKKEEWTYPAGRRKAFLTDGRLVNAEEAGKPVLP